MKLFLRYTRYVAPFWIVQFLILAAGYSPDPHKMWLWYLLTGGFNAVAFIIAYANLGGATA